MASFPTLPIHLVYCILDNLRPVDILMSVCNVCTRLNLIIDSYRPYQVKKNSFATVYNILSLRCILHSNMKLSSFLFFSFSLSKSWTLRDAWLLNSEDLEQPNKTFLRVLSFLRYLLYRYLIKRRFQLTDSTIWVFFHYCQSLEVQSVSVHHAYWSQYVGIHPSLLNS